MLGSVVCVVRLCCVDIVGCDRMVVVDCVVVLVLYVNIVDVVIVSSGCLLGCSWLNMMKKSDF